MMIKPWLIKMAGKTRKYIGFNVLANWVALVANVVVVWSIASILMLAYEGKMKAADGYKTLIIVLVSMAVRVICTMIAANMSFHASNEIKMVLRKKIYNKMCRFGISYTDKIGTSEVVQIAGEGVDQLEIYFGSYLPQLFYSMVAPLTLFAVFFNINRKVALVLLICVPLIPLSIAGVQAVARRLLKQYWGVYADLGRTFLDNVQGLTTLKIYKADEIRHTEMNRQAERFRRITMKVLYMQLNSITVMDVIAYGGAAVGIIISIKEFIRGNVDLGGVLIIILLSADFFIPLRQLGSFFHVAMNGMAASEKMKELFEIQEPNRGVEALQGENPDLIFENVNFSYDGKRKILKDLSFQVKSGEFVCIVGESGCGKSTAALLATAAKKGYWGSIRYGNIEVNRIKEDELMKHVTLVGHNSYLFKGTVRENLLMAKPDASDIEMNKVLRDANVYDFLHEHQGLDTEIAEMGNNLSGGQRQRIAIARALLHNTSFYVFDEATSNIDMESEQMIMDTIQRLAGEKTVLLISHRLANAKAADHIYVVEDGRVAESGNHDNLMKSDGAYSRLYRKQMELEFYRDLNGGKIDAV